MSKVAEGQTNPIPTIGDVVLEEVRDLKTMLTFLRDEGPDQFLSSLRRLGVLHDLSEAQQRTLSALVTEFYARADCIKDMAPMRRNRKAWAKDGASRIRTLKNKMAAARRTIEAVRSHLKRIGVTTGRGVDGALRQALAVLEPASLHEAAAVVSSLETNESSERAAVKLYDFFVECGLPKNEAIVRVGKIGNYLWNWDYPVTECYSGGEKWKGCEAVRKIVARHKRTTDTPNKSR